MTPQNNLDLKGNFQKHPFAELLVEIVQAKLSGSLRVERAKQKSVIYFRDGAIVYAVSNAREQRLFSILLNRKKTDQKTLGQFPDFANDLELAAGLAAKKVFTKIEVDELVAAQVESVVIDVLTWPAGDWLFSPLTRLRDDLVYKTNVHKVLVDYARCLPSQDVYQRFRSVEEAFCREPRPTSGILLQAHEQYALDQFNGTQLTIKEVRPFCSLPETALLQALYVLWLGGLLTRRDWNSAFTPARIDQIRAAKVSLVKSAEAPIRTITETPDKEALPEPEAATSAKPPEIELSLEDYLDRVESAETHYDVLGINPAAAAGDIKNAYFAMAKLFHPDRFHREAPQKLRRIQIAFTQIAHAYETLKLPESRENYDFKMRKQLEYREKRRAAGEAETTAAESNQAEQGLGSFEQAMAAINEEEFAAAAGHLSRAVHYSPQNALYHAYFGYALSHLEKQHHKAEASLQTAVRMDPKNPKIRMMLVEFFIDMKMAKRAVGELNRFLELVPGNKEATKMLAEIQPPVGTPG
ncbi:MAG TPA: DnaJ domain-containing protein [Pyrinomonadaceae bacterium]|nr:DnaJ domain-containing protein [Pyrinomonadaceae bacterium]